MIAAWLVKASNSDPDRPTSLAGRFRCPSDTAAVAESLALAVIVSKDSVFNRLSPALPTGRWPRGRPLAGNAGVASRTAVQ
jgi:hypothetical protein